MNIYSFFILKAKIITVGYAIHCFKKNVRFGVFGFSFCTLFLKEKEG